MAEPRGQHDHGPRAWTDDPANWQDIQPGSGQYPWGVGQQLAGPPPGWPAPPGYPPPRGHSGAPPADAARRGRGFTIAAVVIVAAVTAVIVALVAANVSGRQSPAASAPAAHGPAVGGNGPVTGPGGAGPVTGQGGGTLLMGGQVTKVSSTSITLGAEGHQVTAAFTSSTAFSGVHSSSQIKAGDQVMAQISGYGTAHPVVTALQDPGSVP